MTAHNPKRAGMKIAIVGGGPAGLYLAILLKRRQPQWQVMVLEQNPADATFGFGVVLASNGLQRLQAADAASYEQLVQKMSFTTHQIITHRETQLPIARPNQGGGAIARLDLLNILQRAAVQAGVQIEYGVRIDDLQALAAYQLDDADVVVGADGINSAIRSRLSAQFGTRQQALSNHFAWYGVNKAFATAALVFREYQQGVFVAHYYPYAAGQSTLVAECDHATWQRLGMEVMSNEQRQQLFETVFAPELGGQPLISNNSLWRQFPVITNERWVVGHTVLLGDAHTSAHFSIGSGTRIAMDDAMALAAALVDASSSDERSVAQRLAQFEAARGPDKAKLINASRQSYLWYEQMGQWMRQYTPAQFVHAYMTRTGRMSDQRLWQDYPQLMQTLFEQGVVASLADQVGAA